MANTWIGVSQDRSRWHCLDARGDASATVQDTGPTSNISGLFERAVGKIAAFYSRDDNAAYLRSLGRGLIRVCVHKATNRFWFWFVPVEAVRADPQMSVQRPCILGYVDEYDFDIQVVLFVTGGGNSHCMKMMVADDNNTAEKMREVALADAKIMNSAETVVEQGRKKHAERMNEKRVPVHVSSGGCSSHVSHVSPV
jgi:hypothetical protein